MISDISAITKHHYTSEKCIIGAILKDQEAIYDISDFLEPKDFYIESWGQAYQILLRMTEAGIGIDTVTIKEYMRDKLDEIGGLRFFIEAMDATPNARHIVHYANVVKKYSILRQLARIGHQIIEDVDAAELSPEQIHEKAEQYLSSLRERRNNHLKTFMEVGLQQDAIYEQQFKNPGQTIGIDTGLVDLDVILGGFKPGNLNVLAARPGMGKTAFLTTILEHITQKHKALVFSIEQTSGEIWNRMVSGMTKIDGYDLVTGNLKSSQWTDIFRASNKLKPRPGWINDDGSMSLSKIRSITKKLRINEGIEFVLIDYLQLIKHTIAKNIQVKRYEIVAEISHELKAMAKSLNIPVLCVAALNREAKEHERPQLEFIRESGDVEYDIDVAMFLWSMLERPKEPGQSGAEQFMVTVAKHRGGPVGNVKVVFRKEFTLFQSQAAV